MLFITGCGADNDFVKLLSDNGIGFKLASTASALTEASFGDAVAILAGAYPCGNIIPESWRNAAQSGIKLLIEYPDKLSGVDFEEAEPFGFRRTVAMADAIPGLSGDTILDQHTACCRKVKSHVEPLLAAAAYPDSGAAELEDKLCRFICRIQAVSEDQPYLNGAWLRGFDWELWDYYGSAADSGWGAWSVESGWTCSWISVTLALRGLNKSLWDCYPDG